MRRGLWIAIAALVVVFLAVLLVFGSYVSAKNQMVQKRETITSSWAEVNNQLQRRADLIPNLVETVKGYAKQETTVFGDIANARAGLLSAHGDPKATIQANGQLDGALGRLKFWWRSALSDEAQPRLPSSLGSEEGQPFGSKEEGFARRVQRTLLRSLRRP
jgi:hypothetical protein